MEQHEGTIIRLEAIVSQLSKKEKLVALYILEHPDKVVHQSITELAEQVGVAEATIFRLCKRIGFGGYQGFKIALARDVVKPIENIYQEIDEEDSASTLMTKVFHAHIQGLQDTLFLYDDYILETAMTRLAQADRVQFYGSGGSATIAQDAVHKFIRTGLQCQAFQDSHMQISSAVMLGPQSVAFGISHSGSNKDILQALDLAKQQGAYTIALTQNARSPITKVADLALHTKSTETLYRSEALTSRLIQLAVIDVLYVGVAMKRKDETLDGLERIREAIALKRV
ncbi:DNA-binding MurR/RpiR family transcriptional regulator [Pullulanibacillus pueri]|uniref:RpiR family transcriptional regulator n=1 Tax=Pullulanibacillus pueri TaxID=1437324 RepID=A0A8J3EMW0_9BACL|nr:MurR/RpiR family transcriptional regulator [Pullulanibacillus pueri]MBM7681770.1 DNA-binding MurR/RpiR family transcriptional regulator [Pullulanibacillus pueri]GGH84191.1 RpiR family transcriptional regulator [Pullulanibacillus pueri]